MQMRGGAVTPYELADLIFDHFDHEGAGALASWMLLSGNEDALDPIVEAIHNLVDEIAEEGHADTSLHELTLGNGADGAWRCTCSAVRYRRRWACRAKPGRQIASRKLAASFATWQARIKERS